MKDNPCVPACSVCGVETDLYQVPLKFEGEKMIEWEYRCEIHSLEYSVKAARATEG